MKTLLIVLLSLVVGFCVGVAVMRPSLKQLRVELATKDGELAKREAEEDLAVKQLKLCTVTLQTQNALLRQNNQMMGDLIQRKRRE
jgi:Tfp pilus assembly protein PilX